jgi:hypothetical protein
MRVDEGGSAFEEKSEIGPCVGSRLWPVLPPCMPTFDRCTATPHWHRRVNDMRKLLILLLTHLRSSEM